ncbi:MAG: FHA domain-containing protein [Polyangiaceae bacterium]|nr:FHA domain-containing protein [Polyangiaceae bacterium]
MPADAPRVLAAFLVSYEDADLGVFWPIFQGQNLVGRKGAGDGLGVEIDHPTTSSRHGVFHATARPGRVVYEDVGSTNGTFFGDEKLAPGTRFELSDGQEIRFGGYTAKLKII